MNTVVASNTLQAKSHGLTDLRCTLSEGGVEVGSLRAAKLRTRATLTIGEERFEMERESLMGRFVLKSGDAVIASAVKPSAFRRALTLDIHEQTVDIRPASFWSRAFVLEHEGSEIGRIRKTSWVRTNAEVTLPSEWPLPLRAFAFWLVWVIWRKEAAAASS